jgi:hypothetical protein
MNQRQLAHRKEIMERLWNVEDRASSLGNAAVIEAARTTVKSLEALLTQCAPESNSLEVGRTWKYLGDALYVMFQNQDDQQCLERARHAYGRAEPLLSAAGDRLTYGKLQFNLGNALRLSKVDGEFSLTYLEEAKRRMLAAYEIFIELQPDGVATIEAALQQVDISLKAMSFMKWAQSGNDKIADLKSRLNGPAATTQTLERLSCMAWRNCPKTIRTRWAD